MERGEVIGSTHFSKVTRIEKGNSRNQIAKANPKKATKKPLAFGRPGVLEFRM
jgi:hypothetical protein